MVDDGSNPPLEQLFQQSEDKWAQEADMVLVLGFRGLGGLRGLGRLGGSGV